MQGDDDRPISEFDLSTRVAHALKQDAIETAGQVRALTDEELLRIPNIGRLSLLEIRQVVGGNVPLCAACRRNSKANWSYCPWCGHELAHPANMSGISRLAADLVAAGEAEYGEDR